MDEQLSRRQADDLVGRHAAVGTADPEILRLLNIAQPFEELRVAGHLPRRPHPVSLKKVGQVFHGSAILDEIR
jgi:hypothetical protein